MRAERCRHRRHRAGERSAPEGGAGGPWEQQAASKLSSPLLQPNTRLQGELAAAGVRDPAAALSDLRYACHETCATVLIQIDYQLEAAGQGEERRAAFRRHAAGVLRERPDLPAAWVLAAHGHYRTSAYFRAQVVSGQRSKGSALGVRGAAGPA